MGRKMHSFKDSRGKLMVACSECQRGGNGDQSCSSGWTVKRGGIEKGACFLGKLLPKYETE
jgi:hypothetical protein